ncbi:transcriptional regulator [Candidatus Saccharibacteria bacterium]|nr:transcriptional regulator [Candidatus Saccharibacteria bacterium]MBJ58201.1 transcriptional regulator [Candidatus Saccharibacteria bacterium]|tara:strand:- start:1800 stop:2132 length:333 start_codon:yes stop_codon:yes gene_type:complete
MTVAHQSLKQAFNDRRDLFIAFGDRNRQDIIMLLGEGRRYTVKELSEQLGLSRPATSHHLKILRQAGLLGEERDGRKTYYYPTMRQAIESVKQLLYQFDELEINEGKREI